MEKEKQNVAMTAEEIAEYRAYLAEKKRKETEEEEARQRKMYRGMVDEEIETVMPVLEDLSRDIASVKKGVFDNFKSILDLKSELMMMKSDNQRSHTFTNSAGTMRITLGVYMLDGYTDTVEEGIAMVREYIMSLATDDKSKMLVDSVLRLLSRDQKGTLKASRVIQLKKLADQSGDERFQKGVRIIEESYSPTVSKQFVRAERKDGNGAWKPVPLGMTES